MSRGIVVMPRFSYKSGVTTAELGVRRSDLSFYLTYWDRIFLPQNRAFHIPPMFPADALEALKGQDILFGQEVQFDMSQTNWQMPGRLHGFEHLSPPNQYQVLLNSAFTLLEQHEPGKWSISRSGGNTDEDSLVRPIERSIQFELYDALPTPTGNVPIHEILEYKLTRQDEITALRQTLDDMYLRICSSNDIPMAKFAELTRLESALADLTKSSREKWKDGTFVRVFNGLDIAAITAFGTAVANDRFDLSSTIALAYGGIKFFFTKSPKVEQHPGLQGLGYVHSLPVNAELQSDIDFPPVTVTHEDPKFDESGAFTTFTKMTF